jgi:site-specific recombinase XerD
MAGASIKEIQELAGHKTIGMAARYSHLSPAHKRSVVDLIGGNPKHAPEQEPDSS